MEKNTAWGALIQRFKNTLPGKLKSHHKKSKEVYMQGWNRRRDQFGILVEDSNEQFREGTDQNPYNKGIGKTDLRHKPNSFLH